MPLSSLASSVATETVNEVLRRASAVMVRDLAAVQLINTVSEELRARFDADCGNEYSDFEGYHPLI